MVPLTSLVTTYPSNKLVILPEHITSTSLTSVLVMHDVMWHASIWIIHNNLRIVQLVTNLSINTIEASRWTCQLLAICRKQVLSSWTRITEEHCSVAIGSLRIILTFGRIGSKSDCSYKKDNIYLAAWTSSILTSTLMFSYIKHTFPHLPLWSSSQL